MEAPLRGYTGCRQEHQAADSRKQHLGNKCTHGGGPGNETQKETFDSLWMRYERVLLGFRSSLVFEIISLYKPVKQIKYNLSNQRDISKKSKCPQVS